MDYQALNTLLEEKFNLSKATPGVRDMIIIRLGEAILERTMLAVTVMLSEEEASRASVFLSEGKVENFLDLLSEKHPELNDVVVSIANEVIDEFAGVDTHDDSAM